jgi:hypothetical protein
MVLAGQPVEGEGVLDGFLDPIDELWVAGRPFDDPRGEIAAGLLNISPVVEPAQLLQAVVVGLARQMVQGVAEEVHIASLDGRLGQDLADGRAKAGAIERRRRTRSHEGRGDAVRAESPSRMSRFPD